MCVIHVEIDAKKEIWKDGFLSGNSERRSISRRNVGLSEFSRHEELGLYTMKFRK